MLPEVYYVLARAYDKAGDPSVGATYMREFQHATSAKRDHDAQVLEAERPTAQAKRELEKGNTVAARALFEKRSTSTPINGSPTRTWPKWIFPLATCNRLTRIWRGWSGSIRTRPWEIS